MPVAVSRLPGRQRRHLTAIRGPARLPAISSAVLPLNRGNAPPARQCRNVIRLVPTIPERAAAVPPTIETGAITPAPTTGRAPVRAAVPRAVTTGRAAVRAAVRASTAAAAPRAATAVGSTAAAVLRAAAAADSAAAVAAAAPGLLPVAAAAVAADRADAAAASNRFLAGSGKKWVDIYRIATHFFITSKRKLLGYRPTPF